MPSLLVASRSLALIGALLIQSLLGSGCQERARADRELPQQPARPAPPMTTTQRALRMRLYPCLDCHDKIAASDKPALPLPGEHRDLQLAHFAGVERCHTCHDAANMNQLRLLNGEPATFDEPQRVCGQCHGEKLRDFEIGAHGKIMGSFRDGKYRYGCTDCHNPHAPRREKMQARPAPPFPALGIPKGAHHP